MLRAKEGKNMHTSLAIWHVNHDGVTFRGGIGRRAKKGKTRGAESHREFQTPREGKSNVAIIVFKVKCLWAPDQQSPTPRTVQYSTFLSYLATEQPEIPIKTQIIKRELDRYHHVVMRKRKETEQWRKWNGRRNGSKTFSLPTWEELAS